MKKKLLIPITYSDVSRDVIQLADKWGQEIDAELYFMHVCPDRSMVNTYSGQFFDLTTRDREQMEKFLDDQNITTPYTLAIRTGTTYLNILEEEEAIKPLMIIMPSHSHTLLSRLLLGSNTDYIVHNSKGPVYIFKKSKKPLKENIIVPLDFTNVNKTVVHIADEWAMAAKSEIYFIHVGTFPNYYGNSIEYDMGFTQEEINKINEETQDRLESFVESLRVKAVHHTVLEFGKPNQQIHELQKKIDAKLILMAAHSHTMLHRFIAGSTTDYLLHHSSCPLYIYKNPAE